MQTFVDRSNSKKPGARRPATLQKDKSLIVVVLADHLSHANRLVFKLCCWNSFIGSKTQAITNFLSTEAEHMKYGSIMS